MVKRFWNKQLSACSDIYAQIRSIEELQLSDAEKRTRVREAKTILNGIQRNALSVAEAYDTSVRRNLHGESEEDRERAYREANRECFGAAYALQTESKDAYEKAQAANQNGVSYEDYYQYYFTKKELSGNGNEDARTIAYLQSSGFSKTTQAELYFADFASDSERMEQADLEDSAGISPGKHGAQRHGFHRRGGL